MLCHERFHVLIEAVALNILRSELIKHHTVVNI